MNECPDCISAEELWQMELSEQLYLDLIDEVIEEQDKKSQWLQSCEVNDIKDTDLPF